MLRAEEGSFRNCATYVGGGGIPNVSLFLNNYRLSKNEVLLVKHKKKKAATILSPSKTLLNVAQKK